MPEIQSSLVIHGLFVLIISIKNIARGMDIDYPKTASPGKPSRRLSPLPLSAQPKEALSCSCSLAHSALACCCLPGLLPPCLLN